MTFNVNYSLFIEFCTIFIFKKSKTGCQEYNFSVKAEKAPKTWIHLKLHFSFRQVELDFFESVDIFWDHLSITTNAHVRITAVTSYTL